jgi:hypothetical protein
MENIYEILEKTLSAANLPVKRKRESTEISRKKTAANT